MKRTSAALIVFALLVATFQFSANAAAKAGAKCTKVGSKSVVGAKTFTCMKSGTKLIWNKGASQSPGKNL
jgi:hypothetical protein